VRKLRSGGLSAILTRRGITDPFVYLEMHGKSARVMPSTAPDVRVRGSVQLMKKQKISRSEVDKQLSALKYL
jgi:hypothetical protein